jgi:hypothetical protein
MGSLLVSCRSLLYSHCRIHMLCLVYSLRCSMFADIIMCDNDCSDGIDIERTETSRVMTFGIYYDGLRLTLSVLLTTVSWRIPFDHTNSDDDLSPRTMHISQRKIHEWSVHDHQNVQYIPHDKEEGCDGNVTMSCSIPFRHCISQLRR